MSRPRGFSTRAIHDEHLLDVTVPSTPSSTPIFQTAGFAFDSVEEIDSAITGGGPAFFYSRVGNPTVDALERLMAELEGGDVATAYASGMGAIHGTLAATLKPGDHVVVPKSLYGGTHGILSDSMKRWGIETSYVPVTDLEAWRAAIRPNTKLLWAETITNPTLEVVDLAALAEIAHAAGARLAVDATFTTPYVCRPLEHGADFVVHSATKYLGGHGDLLAGVVVGKKSAMGDIRRTLIQTGGNIAPFVAWLILRATKTLSLRMERHMSSALAVARFLEDQSQITGLAYPGLTTHPDHAVAARLFDHGFGAIVSFAVRGGDEAARRFIGGLELFRIAGSLGDPHSLAILPAVASHRHVPEAERQAMGIGPGFVRMSIGLEDPEDLIADIRAALP